MGLSGELLSRARAGDAEALEALVTRHGERLLSRIRLMLGAEARRRAESRDYLQSLLSRVIAELPGARVKDEQHFIAWATRIARNDLRDAARKRRALAFDSLSASVWTPADGGGPATAAANEEQRESLVSALESMAEDHRAVLELRHFEELSFRDIAERLERSEAAAQMLHSRALTQLGQRMRGV